MHVTRKDVLLQVLNEASQVALLLQSGGSLFEDMLELDEVGGLASLVSFAIIEDETEVLSFSLDFSDEFVSNQIALETQHDVRGGVFEVGFGGLLHTLLLLDGGLSIPQVFHFKFKFNSPRWNHPVIMGNQFTPEYMENHI